MEYIAFLFTLAIGITLLGSGILKIIDIKATIMSFITIGMLPNGLMKTIGILLPFLELSLGSSLIFLYIPIWIKVSTLILFTLFFFINMYVTITDQEVTCNCFGFLFEGKLGIEGALHSLMLILYCLPILYVKDFVYADFFNNFSKIDNLIIVAIIFCLVYFGFLLRFSTFSIDKGKFK